MQIQIIGIGTSKETNEALSKAIEERTGIKPEITKAMEQKNGN